MMRTPRWAFWVVLWLLALPAASARAELSDETVAQVDKVEESLSRVAKLYRSKKQREAAKVLEETTATIDRLALELSDEERAELQARLADWRRRTEAAKRLLSAKDAPAGGVSFTKEVAPLLVASCAGCHIRESRGGFSVATYDALVRGSENGTVLFPGDGEGSRLYEVLDTGDMPRGGNRLPDAALATVRKWIDEGAKFDGPSSATPLTELAVTSDSPSTAPGMPSLVKPTGSETISFSRDIAGVIADNCLGCHGGNNVRANLNLSNFEGFLKGSDNGALFIAGKPEESLLIGKLKGTAGGARMPMGRDPLPDETIAKVEKWIAEGATFDGTEAKLPLRQLWENALAASLSAEELSELRTAQAAKNWKLALPDVQPTTFEGKSYYLVGNANQTVLKEIATAAEAQQGKIAQSLRIQRGNEVFKGRVTVFVFQKRVEYTEFAQLVESRGVPQEVMGHWRYSAFDPYVCIVLPADPEASVRPLLAVQLAGLGVASIAETPRWFSQGLARAIAAKAEGREPEIRTWDAQVAPSLSQIASADLFLGSDGATGANAFIAYGFCRDMLNDNRRYGRLLAALRDGQPFDAAFAAVYMTDPKAAFEAWAGIAPASQ